MSHSNLTTGLHQLIFGETLNDYGIPDDLFNDISYKQDISSRSLLVILAPLSIITSAVDTIIGIGLGCAAIVPCSKQEKIFQYALNHLTNPGLQWSYSHLVQALNLQAFDDDDDDNDPPSTRIAEHCNDYLLKLLNVPSGIADYAEKCFKSESFFKKHLISRLTYTVLPIVAVVTGLASLIIGVLAAGLSFIRLGRVKSINRFAYAALWGSARLGSMLPLSVIQVFQPGFNPNVEVT